MTSGSAKTLETLALAFNAKDLARFAACYQEDATIGLQGDAEPLYQGIDGIRALYDRAFRNDPTARVEILGQFAAGEFVTERERVRGKDGAFEAVVVYEMRDGRIARQWVAGTAPFTETGLIALVTDDKSLIATWRTQHRDSLISFPDPFSFIAAGTANPAMVRRFATVYLAETFTLAPALTGKDLALWLETQGFPGRVEILPLS